MKKTVFVYGLIAGFLSICILVFSPLFMGDLNMESMANGMVIGYVCITLSAILICFGIASYKKNHLGGSISYVQAIKVGLLTCLVASTVYVGIWMAMYKPFFAGFGKQYAAVMTEQMKKKGESEADIVKMKETMVKYDNNALYRAGFTYLEPLSVQIPIVLIAAIFISRKRRKTIVA